MARPYYRKSNFSMANSVGYLMRMSINDRVVLTMRHFSECSYQEIGHILDLDEKTVKSRLFEARHRLRDMLKGLRPD